jgi:hypothetical protein
VAQSTGTLCPVGFYSQGVDGTTGAQLPCQPISDSCGAGNVAVGMALGRMVCSTDTPLVSASQQKGNPAVLPTAADTCAAYSASYQASLLGNAVGLPTILPAPSSTVCGDLSPTPPTSTQNSGNPSLPVTPPAATCFCGASTIATGQYCGVCSFGTDTGYGYGAVTGSQISTIELCSGGGLQTVAPSQIASITPPSPITNCNQTRRLVNCTPNATGALACVF